MGKITTQDKWIITGLLSPFIIIFMFKFIVYPAVIIDISRNQESEQFVLPADSLEEIQDTYHKYLAYKDSFYFMRDTMFTEEVKLLPRTEREYLNLKIKRILPEKDDLLQRKI